MDYQSPNYARDAARENLREIKGSRTVEEGYHYGEIAPLANLDMDNPGHRDEIGKILGIISTYEFQQGRPMLSAIVIHRDDNIPGGGFFELARELGRLGPGEDRLAFRCGEVVRIHEVWAQQDLR